MNQLAPISDTASAIAERVIINGDLSRLTPQERVNYYTEVCKSVGLNPLTKPFDYITLNGKLTLYALRACTDQLRSVYAVSVEEMAESERDGVFIVTAKVRNGQGRTDIAKGAVSITGLKGEALANAMMKAETKAKRRATLSLCGLGWLDESEVDSISGAAKGEPNAQATAIHNSPTMPAQPEIDDDVAAGARNFVDKHKDILLNYTDMDQMTAWLKKKASLGPREGNWDRPTPGSDLDKLLKFSAPLFNELKNHYMEKMREV